MGSSPVTCTKASRRNTACFLLLIRLKNAVAELHEIFDFVEAEFVPQHEIFDFVEAELVPQADSAHSKVVNY